MPIRFCRTVTACWQSAIKTESFNIRDGLNRALTILSGLKHRPEALANAEELLQSSMIQVEEAIHEIEQSYRSF